MPRRSVSVLKEAREGWTATGGGSFGVGKTRSGALKALRAARRRLREAHICPQCGGLLGRDSAIIACGAMRVARTGERARGPRARLPWNPKRRRTEMFDAQAGSGFLRLVWDGDLIKNVAIEDAAPSGLGCIVQRGELVPTVGGKPMANVDDRKECFRELLGDRYRDLRLDELQDANDAKLREMIGKADLLVVRSDDIDKAGEGTNQPSARRFMSSILDDVIRVAQRLAGAGVRRMVFVADHGHVLIPDIPAGDVVRSPPGEWIAEKRRCRLGRAAGVSDGVRVVKASHLGIHGAVDDVAVATGFRVFTKGAAYFHEGVSLQECLVPVVTLAAKGGRAAVGTNHVAVTYRHPKFTQRVFIAKLKLTSIEKSEMEVRVTAIASGASRPVGQAADCEARDPATGLIRLRVGVEEAVAIRIDDAFTGPDVEIQVVDAAGVGLVLGSLKLKNGSLD